MIENLLPCPLCGKPGAGAYAKPTGLEGWPHVVVYRHQGGGGCEDWRGAKARRLGMVPAGAVVLGMALAITVACGGQPSPAHQQTHAARQCPSPLPSPDALPSIDPELIPAEYTLAVRHPQSRCGCGGIAFYYRAPAEGPLLSAKAMMPDGKRPEFLASPMRCGSCGRVVTLADLHPDPRTPKP